MELSKIEKKYRLAIKAILIHRLKDAFDLIRTINSASGENELSIKLNNYQDTYSHLLNYTIKGITDPEREKIYLNLQRSLLELADRSKELALSRHSNSFIYQLKRKLKPDLLEDKSTESVQELTFSRELTELIENTGSKTDSERPEYQEVMVRVFDIIWLSDQYHTPVINLVKEVINTKDLAWHEKSTFVSALTLSLIRYFDVTKFDLLADFYLSMESRVKERALVGLILGFHQYNDRFDLFPGIKKTLDKISADPNLEKDLENAFLQFIRSKETEKVTRKLEEEIIPEMIKMGPKLKEKLDLDNIIPDEFSEDKNPDWEMVFEDSPGLLNKLEEFSQMQLEGADVFLSAFSKLKHFNFFRQLPNWFLPFHSENYDVKNALRDDKELFDVDEFLRSMSQSAYMCNSDKYSFVLNIPMMPETQKKMMIELFSNELKTMNELSEEDEKLSKDTSEKVYTRYIQDLYRFFKLHPLKSEFEDVFKWELDFYHDEFFPRLLQNTNIIKRIGEFYFARDQYRDALEVFLKLSKMGDTSMEIFEKVAFCYEKTGQYDEALQFYKKAELYGTNTHWHLRKIAFCYRHLKDYQNALKYYTEAEKLKPDNLQIQLSIGNTYLEKGEFENALNRYYKIEYLAPDNKKVWRPIAWCSFIAGKHEDARRYNEKLLAEEPNKYDYMNLGHVEWCTGNIKAAGENYLLSLSQKGNNLRSFLESFREDTKHLVKHGISEQDIDLMVDYLKFRKAGIIDD